MGNQLNPQSLQGTEWLQFSILQPKQHASHYQLSERMGFVRPADSVVAELLFGLGNLYALTSNVESAERVYAEAERYGYHGQLLWKRKACFWRLRVGADIIPQLAFLALLGLGGSGLWRLAKTLRRLARQVMFGGGPNGVG